MLAVSETKEQHSKTKNCERCAGAVQLIKNEGLNRDAWIWFLRALIGSCLLELQVAGPPH